MVIPGDQPEQTPVEPQSEDVEPATDGQPAAKPRKRRRRLVIDLAAVGVLVCVLAYVHTRVVRVVYVTTGSMMPTVNPGDRMLMHLGAYKDHPPRRGDVIAFWLEDKSEYEVKRVIAVEGDTLTVFWRAVFVNGEQLNEPYIRQPMQLEPPTRAEVGVGELFLMGDNRNSSEDSRDYGPVAADQVLGRVFYRLLPLGRAGPIEGAPAASHSAPDAATGQAPNGGGGE